MYVCVKIQHCKGEAEGQAVLAGGRLFAVCIHQLYAKLLGFLLSDKAIPMVTVVALGPTSGLGQLKAGYILPEFLIRSLKSKDLFIPRTWKENGLSVPK